MKCSSMAITFMAGRIVVMAGRPSCVTRPATGKLSGIIAGIEPAGRPGGTEMKVKSTLKVINQKNYKGRRGVTDGQTYQRLVGWPEVFATDRVRLGRATYKPGTYE